ncbi:unnamed protein product [Clonostachys solani]|uniref:Uncharacterized protein n=1 Tax=Clonostachys solani TaxID=160281 RepID=A0A9N9Z1Z8_9HYPO|nr:unnamed protein product [Clonostachys solani]
MYVQNAFHALLASAALFASAEAKKNCHTRLHTTSTPSASSELASTPSASSIESPSSSQVFSSPVSSPTPILSLSTLSTPTPISSITVSSSSTPSTTPSSTEISSTSTTSALPTQTPFRLIASSPSYAAADGQPARYLPSSNAVTVYLVAPSASWVPGEFVFEESTGYVKIATSDTYLVVGTGFALTTAPSSSTSSKVKCSGPVQAGVALSCWQEDQTTRNAFFVTNFSTSQTIAMYPSTLSVSTLSKIQLLPQLVAT